MVLVVLLNSIGYNDLRDMSAPIAMSNVRGDCIFGVFTNRLPVRLSCCPCLVMVLMEIMVLDCFAFLRAAAGRKGLARLLIHLSALQTYRPKLMNCLRSCN
jgi:hypothetical protein